MLPPIAKLLKSLDQLPHGGRMSRVCQLAFEHRQDPSMDDWLHQLFQESPMLGLDAARHSGRNAFLVQALLDPRSRVAWRALSLVQMPADLSQARDQGCAAIRRGVLRKLSHQGDPAQVAALLPLVEERHGPREAAGLIARLESQSVLEQLHRLHPHVPNWRRLALRHPGPVLDWLEQTLSALPPRERLALWNRLQPATHALAEQQPARLLDLALRLCGPDELPPLPLGRLALHFPDQVLALLTRPVAAASEEPSAGPGTRIEAIKRYRETTGASLLAAKEALDRMAPAARSVWARAHSLPADVLRHLDRLGLDRVRRLVPPLAHEPGRLAQLLEACPPRWRAPLFEEAYGQDDLSGRVWPLGLLGALPHSLRCREAERMLGMRQVETDPALRLQVASYASTQVSTQILSPACQAALAEDRAQAVRLWLRSCGCNRAGLGETLARLVPRLKNEQDPVRLAACQALAALPPSMITAETLEPLGKLLEAVVQARDTSWSTRYALQSLGQSVLRLGAADPQGPLLAFSLNLQRSLVGQTGSLAWPVLRDLPRGAEHRLVVALLQWVDSSKLRDNYSPVLSLARALGKRAWKVEALQQRLEEATRAKPDLTTALTAIDLWLADPGSREGRARQLLDKDPTCIVAPRVFGVVHRRRQDWLDPYLAGKILKGRFLSQKTVYLLPARGGFFRWLPRQQQAFARLLNQVAQDDKRADRERAGAIKILCRLSETRLSDLQVYFESTNVSVQEAALAACARLDPPSQSLGTLLEQLDGDRARVAMYAVPAVALWTPPQALVGVLRELLARPRLKVTVHKEVLRLIGAYRVPGAAEILHNQWNLPEVHRDVRIAVLHAARAIWEWPLLEEAAQSPDPYVARALCDQSPDGLTAADRARYAPLVVALGRHPVERVRQEAFLSLPRWAPGLEGWIAASLQESLVNLELGPEWKAACSSLVRVCQDGPGSDSLVRSVKELAALPPLPEAGLERDRPAFQRLLALTQAMQSLPWERRQALREVFESAAQELPDPLSCRLRVASLDWQSGALPDTEFPGELLAALARELQDRGFEWEGMEAVVESLSQAMEVTARRAAVLLVKACGARLAWPAGWRERLEALRQDADGLVRWEASLVFTVAE